MRVVITGDKSRYQFFRYFLDKKYIENKELFYTEKVSEKNIFMTSDINKRGENIYISKKLPLNTLLFFPKEYQEEIYAPQDKIILFDEFPYATKENILKLDKIIKIGNYKQLEVVLIINDREKLDTDITTEETALKAAENIYKKKKIKVSKYKFGEIPVFLFSSISSVQNNNRNKLKGILNDLKFIIETFDMNYELFYEESELNKKLSNPAFINNFFEYNKNINGKNIWQYYFEKIFNYFWDDNNSIGDKFCITFYKITLNSSYIWDISYDIENLKIDIRKFFMNKIYFSKEKVFFGDKNEYDILLNNIAKDLINFKQELINFFSKDVKKYLKQRIEKNIDKLEGLVNDSNN